MVVAHSHALTRLPVPRFVEVEERQPQPVRVDGCGGSSGDKLELQYGLEDCGVRSGGHREVDLSKLARLAITSRIVGSVSSEITNQ